MSQNDFSLANQGFPQMRADMNSALQALASNSSGATAPGTTYAYQFWYDTATNLLKMRNADNNDWITLAAFDQTTDEWEIRSAVIQAVDSAGVVIKTDDGTTRVTVADDGTVSIANDLSIADKIVHTGDTNTAIRFPAADTVTVETAGTERMRIASDGKVGIATTSPSALLVVDGGSADYSPSASGTGLFHVTAGATSQYTFYVGVEDAGVHIGHNGGGTRYLAFDTNETERMRIDSSGNLLVGATVSGQNGHSFAGSGFYITRRSGTSSQAHIEFRNDNGGVGNIVTNGTATAYNTSSDYRLKEDVQPMVGASDRLMALKPVNFAWKVDGSRVDGFLAHEAQEVVPESVTGEKDAVDGEGNPVYQGIDQSKIVPLLTAALQEALTKIEALEARVAALEAS